MTRTRKLAAILLLVVVVTVSVLTMALAFDETETYAYLPDHSVYFYDVAEQYAWAHQQIDTLAVASVIQGSGNHLFYPGNAITRADFIVMLDRAYGMSEALDSGLIASKGTFADVPANAYYSKAVTAAKAFGIATGASGNRFLPTQSMTRQDAMVFIKRTLDCTSMTLSTGSLAAFPDSGSVSAYAKDAVGALVKAGVISGSHGKLNPTSNITRAEMAVMLYRTTHLTDTGNGPVYQQRSDVINVCIGAQNYCDVVVENYNPNMTYEGLVKYSNLRQENGVTYITIEGSRQTDYTAVYADGEFTFRDVNGDAVTVLPAAVNCVAVDVSKPYHQIAAPVSTGKDYKYCHPSVVDGQVSVVYYSKA